MSEVVEYADLSSDPGDSNQQVVTITTSRLPIPAPMPPRFTNAVFVGHVKTKMGFDTKGDWEFTVVVPYKYRHNALPLMDAAEVPLLFEITPYRPMEHEQNGD